jgi:diguanylate cyclase (GGDEF) domain
MPVSDRINLTARVGYIMEEKSSRLLAEYLKSILYGPRVEESLNLTEIDESCMELAQGLNDLRSMMEALEEYSAELSKGNLSVKFPEINNILCANLKNLHSNLKLLAWRARQAAKGEYSGNPGYLGELSEAFDTMVKQVMERERGLKDEASKAQSHAESIEGYNELLLGMLSKRKEWLLVVDTETKEILYCNKKNKDGTADQTFCKTCKKRLSFQNELLHWNDAEQYHVWEIDDVGDKHYRVTSFMVEWRGRQSGVHIVVDVTEEKQAARSLTSKAYHDPGTGIKNRLFFDEYMDMILREHQEATFCYFDLDGLKYVNDTFGHMEGDMYIQNFVELIKRNFRTGDTFARTGGDEFCLVLTGCIKELMDRKMEEILKEFQMSDFSDYQCSFSFGIVEIPGKDNTLTLDEIIQRADSIMYECKRRNKAKYPKLVRDGDSE